MATSPSLSSICYLTANSQRKPPGTCPWGQFPHLQASQCQHGPSGRVCPDVKLWTRRMVPFFCKRAFEYKDSPAATGTAAGPTRPAEGHASGSAFRTEPLSPRLPGLQDHVRSLLLYPFLPPCSICLQPFWSHLSSKTQ